MARYQLGFVCDGVMNNKLQAILAYYITKLAAEELSKSTKRSYASLARQFIYFLEDCDSSEDIAVGSFVPLAQKFLSSQRDGKASSINARASAIKHFLKLSGIPCETFERPQTSLTTREPLTDDELSSFLEAARHFQPRDKAIGMILATTGIRLQECAVLNLDDVDCIGESDVIVLAIRRSWGRQQIPLNAETQAALEEYLAVKDETNILSDDHGHPLFVDKSGERLSLRALTASVRKIGWSAKLAVTPAVLRLTRLMQIARGSNDAVTLAYLGGFDSLESARRILRACKNDLTPASVEAVLDDPLADVGHYPAEEIEISPLVNTAPLVSEQASSPTTSSAQEREGMELSEITDQNYLTVLGRALDIIDWTDEQADNYCLEAFNVPHWDELGRRQAEAFIAHLQSLFQNTIAEDQPA